ncbi:MAG: hypothetical protein LC659_09440 [Myxococcales bacterium]|nr:hypothetical protein [Myxococcales bacterium]
MSLTSADPNTLTVDSPVAVNPGDQDVPINVTGVARNPTAVTITATANGVSRSGNVRVLGDRVTVDVPTFAALAPATGNVSFGGTINLAATLDPVVDSVSFGPGTAVVVAQITGFATRTTFAEGTYKSINDSSSTKSCARHPNGYDSDDLATDWTLQTTPNPCLANP